MEASGQHHVPAALFPAKKKNLRHPLNRNLDGQESRSGLSWDWKLFYDSRNRATIHPRSSSPGPIRSTEHAITAATSCMLLCFSDVIFCPKKRALDNFFVYSFRFTLCQYVVPRVLAVGNLGFWKSLGSDLVTYVLFYLTFSHYFSYVYMHVYMHVYMYEPLLMNLSTLKLFSSKTVFWYDWLIFSNIVCANWYSRC